MNNKFIDSLEYYEKLINGFAGLEPEEMLLLQTERDEIHRTVAIMKKEKQWTKEYDRKLRSADNKLKSRLPLKANRAAIEGHSLDSKNWWWRLSE